MTWSGDYAIANGDVFSTLRELPDNEFDALFCDPPYGLGTHQPTVGELIAYLQGAELDTGGDFMGKDWSVPSVSTWREAYRVLKPGAYLLAFAGSRTGDLISIGLRAAGFEVRDCLMWVYGKGFPKSLDVSKAIDKAAGASRPVKGMGAAHCKYIARGGKCPGHGDVGRYGEMVHAPATSAATAAAAEWAGYGTALKPSFEPIYLARKPLEGTVAQNVAKWGVGGLAIDACRIGRPEGDRASGWSKTGSHAGENVAMSGGNTERAPREDAAARWPANLILDEEAGRHLDASVSPTTSVPFRENTVDGAVLPMKKRTAGGYSDSGGPSRFFYSSKVSTKEREWGCESLPTRLGGSSMAHNNGTSDTRIDGAPVRQAHNAHPTLKPIALARWLAALIKPPTDNATLLIPYSGAGSEMIGALQAGWPMVFGIERDPEYIDIANARLTAWKKGAP